MIVTLGASQGLCAVLAYHVLINEKTLQVWSHISSALPYVLIIILFTELR